MRVSGADATMRRVSTAMVSRAAMVAATGPAHGPAGGFPVPFRFGGPVTCLLVGGNRASIKYRFDHADSFGPPIRVDASRRPQPSTRRASRATSSCTTPRARSPRHGAMHRKSGLMKAPCQQGDW